MWLASNQKNPLPALEENSVQQAWLIWRHELKLLFRSLTSQEAFCFDAFMQGQCFAEVCEGLCEWLDEEHVALSAASFLQVWVRDGWIANYSITKIFSYPVICADIPPSANKK